MHDKNGNAIGHGDYLKCPGKTPFIGRVSKLYPGTNTCNVTIAYLVMGGVESGSVTASECDLLLRADGGDEDIAPHAPLPANALQASASAPALRADVRDVTAG